MTRLIDADLLKDNIIKCLKLLEPEEENDFSGDEFEDGFTFGWNACVRKIMGERK